MDDHTTGGCERCRALALAIADDVATLTWPSTALPDRVVSTDDPPTLRMSGTPDIVGGEWLVTIRIAGCAPPSGALGESYTTPRRQGLAAAIWRALSELLPRHGITSLLVEAHEMGRTFWARRDLATRFDLAHSERHGASFAAWFGRGTLPSERKGAIAMQVMPAVPIARLDRLIAERRHEELGRLIAEHTMPSHWEPHVGTWIERDDWHGIVELRDPGTVAR